MPDQPLDSGLTGLTTSLSEQDQRLLAMLDDLPLAAEPWHVVADELGCSKSDMLDRLARWYEDDAVRHVRAMFNSRMLGYEATLVGMAVKTNEADEIAGQIAKLATVSHNFLREGCKYNLWFTLTCPPKDPTLAEAIDELKHRFDKPLIRLDTTQHFKISFGSVFHTGTKPSWLQKAQPTKPVQKDILLQAVGILQNDLPLVDRPFEAMARQGTLSESQLLDAMAALKDRRIIRRVGAVLNLPKLTEIQNVMCVWNLPEQDVEAFARNAANHPRISHCYRRNDYPDWPWKLYTVIHGRNRGDCQEIIAELAESDSHAEYLPLWTIKEYKQTPVRYDPEKVALKI
jgi:DNA-binding Lrp family transcriptional regulator